MSEDSKRHDMIPSILSAAISAAGPLGSNEAAWKAKINRAIPHIAAMMHDGSHQWRTAVGVIDAAVFVATYKSHSLEESSTRIVVQIDTGRPSKNYPDGIEPIRTHRTDTAAGRDMRDRLDQLEPGDEIVIWKAMESIGEGADANKVRTLVHMETRPKRSSSRTNTGTPPPPASAHDDGEPVESPPIPGGSGPRQPHYTDSIDSERIIGWRKTTVDRLDDQQFATLKSRLESRGYDFNGVSEVEWVEVVRPIIHSILNPEGN